MYRETTALKKILQLTKRIRVIQGGTSAGKTIAIMLYLADYAAMTEKTSISVIAESVPHLKRGAMRDFLNIMKGHNIYRESRWSRSDSTYEFENGSYIEFFSADDPAKLRGARRDVLFINECNNVAHSAYEQLEVRTKKMVILDFNPVSEFWVHTEVMPHVEHDFLKLTYKDNEALDPAIIQSIESRKHNANWWRIYGLGEIGVKEGQVYTNWKPIKAVPKDAVLKGYGLDFGYTNNPTGIVAVWKWNNAYVLDEIEYRTGLQNRVIGQKLLDLPEAERPTKGLMVVADAAEPKSIDEIRGMGVNIIGATKGQGSVNFGIQIVQDQEIFYTERSINLRKEQMNYLWKLDKDGKPMNVPENIFNHLMDGTRYIITELEGKAEPGIISMLKGQIKEAQADENQK